MLLAVEIKTAHGVIDHNNSRSELVITQCTGNKKCKGKSPLIRCTGVENKAESGEKVRIAIVNGDLTGCTGVLD